MTAPAGLDREDGASVTAAIRGLIAGGDGNLPPSAGRASARAAASAFPPAPRAVNPRFMLVLARLAVAKRQTADDAAQDGRDGVPQDEPRRARDVADAARRRDVLHGSTATTPIARPRSTSSSIPAATCAARRTSRSCASTSWTRSASPTESRAGRRRAAASSSCVPPISNVAGNVAYRTSDRFAAAPAQARAGLVPDLPHPVQRDRAAGPAPAGARTLRLRHGAVREVPGRAARRSCSPLLKRPRRKARRAARASRRRRRQRGGRR